MPEANEMFVGTLAVVAQAERKMISERTKAALAAAKARGKRLGTPGNLRNQHVGRANGRATKTEKARTARQGPQADTRAELKGLSLCLEAILPKAGAPGKLGGRERLGAAHEKLSDGRFRRAAHVWLLMPLAGEPTPP
jgi:hypothetical protein